MEQNLSGPISGVRTSLLLSALLVGAALLCPGSVGAQEPVQIRPKIFGEPMIITSKDLLNLTYPNEFTAEKTAPLINGSYSEPAAPGSASRVEVRFQRAAFNQSGGNGHPIAAVVLSTNTGGSGTFHELHLVKWDPIGLLQPVARRMLGDRIRLQGLAFVDAAIRVDYTGFTVGDPRCCPTLNIAQEFHLHDGELELMRAVEAPALLAVPAGLSLIGWYGGPTDSRALLAAAPPLESVWAYDAGGGWIGDLRELPSGLRQTIPIERGHGLFVRSAWATELPVPLLPAPAVCPLNSGPPNPVDSSMLVQQPGNGEWFNGVVTVAGLARAFEGNIRIRILAGDRVLADTFTTAAGGAPAFGIFAAEVPVAVERSTDACVQIFEESARDGSQINVVQTAVHLTTRAIAN